MPIRLAQIHEWHKVQDFCTNTFQWGDYIEDVWDSWVKSKSLLVYEDNDTILGICNVVTHNTEAWIEGLRVDVAARRRHIGKSLLRAAEEAAIQQGAIYSRSAIESSNMPSLHMCQMAGYKIEQKWHMYRCDAQPHATYGIIKPAPKHMQPNRYVNSWMWVNTSNISPDHILHMPDGPVFILSDSDRFPNTLMVTIYNNAKHDINDTIHYISNLAYNKNQSVQIFSTDTIRHKALHDHNSTITVVLKQIS